MAKVFIGLSGGVDSSVSAALLKEQGQEVTGVYMKNWTRDVAGVACPWKQDLADARAAAAVLDIPFKVYDFQDAYRERVVEAMVAEYAAGRTPNPDVMCNQEIKFKLFLQAALADGADMIATGHYAQTEGGRLLRAADANKDQTYFLYRVERSALERAFFPVGGLTKPRVRELAREFRLPTAAKRDSQGICFVGEVGIRGFLREYVTTAAGPVVDRNGAVLGEHQGAVFYTVGQRHGLGIGGGRPFYVLGTDVVTNTVTVTERADDLVQMAATFGLRDVHWIGRQPLTDERYAVRLRHRGELLPGKVLCERGRWRIELSAPARAVAAGQSAVVYDGAEVLGGGIIAAV